MVRLKQPSLSPDRESAPHWRTTALGWYISITLAMIYTNDSIQSLKWFCPSREISTAKTSQSTSPIYSQVWRWLHMTHRQSHPSEGNSQHSIYPSQHRCPAENKANVNSLYDYNDVAFIRQILSKLTLRSPVPGKYSPYLWKETVITRSVV